MQRETAIFALRFSSQTRASAPAPGIFTQTRLLCPKDNSRRCLVRPKSPLPDRCSPPSPPLPRWIPRCDAYPPRSHGIPEPDHRAAAVVARSRRRSTKRPSIVRPRSLAAVLPASVVAHHRPSLSVVASPSLSPPRSNPRLNPTRTRLNPLAAAARRGCAAARCRLAAAARRGCAAARPRSARRGQPPDISPAVHVLARLPGARLLEDHCGACPPDVGWSWYVCFG